jgi:hypothetical protein
MGGLGITPGGSLSIVDELNNLFPAGDDVGVKRRYLASGSLTTYWMYKHLNSNRYWLIQFVNQTITAGNNTMVLSAQTIATLYKAFNTLSTPAFTYSGAGWTVLQAQFSSYPGGDLVYSANAGDYIEKSFTGTTVGAVSFSATSYLGIAKITIDGDATLANLLPTAQQLVDGGSLASSALVANGGTLNPTDRCWDAYMDTADITAVDGGEGFLFASNLSDAAHTLRINVTGYKNPASGAALVMVAMVLVMGAATRTTDGGHDFLVNLQSTCPETAWEISYSFIPYTGGSNYQWLGHAGQSKIATLGLTMDAVAVTLNGENSYLRVAGSELIVSQSSNIVHPDTGAEVLGIYALTHTLNKNTGLTIAHTVSWDTAGTMQSVYPCMMGVEHSIYDRFNTPTNSPIDLTDADGSIKLLTQTGQAWCWDFNGNQGAMMNITDLAATVNNWQDAGATGLGWNDANQAWKKTYPLRATNKAFTASSELTSSCNYRVQWFVDGANASLSGVS